jgi:hypothetical protein
MIYQGPLIPAVAYRTRPQAVLARTPERRTVIGKELHSTRFHIYNAADAALTWLNGAPATMADHSSTSTSPASCL